MRIRRLTLCPYRNFPALDVDLGQAHALITGANGRGKSNILEAISYLSIGKSIRGARDQDVVPHGGRFFDIRAAWLDGERAREARLYYEVEEGKRAFVDGAPLARISDLVSRFQTVHFAPEDVALVLQFSAQRRRLVDILLSQASGPYLADLQRYQRVLSQRNQYLKQMPRHRTGELEVWDGQLARLGAALRVERLAALQEMVEPFGAAYESLSTGQEVAGFEYRDDAVINGAPVPQREELTAAMAGELAEQWEQERRTGFTLSGPHRDAVAFTLDGVEADTFGSQGQLKSLLVAWKMAEVRFLQERSGQVPVLLLDDVFSELDRDRSEQVLAMVDGFEQVVVTSPRALAEDVMARFERIDLDG